MPPHGIESYQLIDQLIQRSGGSANFRRQMLDTGSVTKLDRPLLESWTREAADFASIDPLSKTARLISATGSLLPLQWLCGRCGVFFVRGGATFSEIVGKGARTWFAASLQIHELRQTVIKAFLDSPGGKPHIDEREGRLIARCWASVFSWIEGFLEIHGGGLAGRRVPDPSPADGLNPALFRTTPPWLVLSEAFAAPGCPSRTAITEKVAHPFGAVVKNRKGDWASPNENTVDKWTERRPADVPPGTGTRGPLDYTLALCYAAGSLEPLEWLAAQAGGRLVVPANALTDGSNLDDPLRFWERTMVELAELDASIARALLDHRIDQAEMTRLRAEWADVVAWMKAFAAEW